MRTTSTHGRDGGFVKYPHISDETKDALIEKHGGEEGALRFLADEVVIQYVDRKLKTIDVFDPAAFVGKTWKIVDTEMDARAALLPEVDFAKVGGETCLRPEDNNTITGEEKLRRLREGSDILLGPNVFLALWREKDHQTLEWLYREKKASYFEFYGELLEDRGGNIFVLCIFREEHGNWRWGYLWIGRERTARHLALTIAS